MIQLRASYYYMKGYNVVSKKIKAMLVLLLVGHSAQAGITFGKIAELPMRLCLGVAMLYTGKQAYEYGRIAVNIQKMKKNTPKLSADDILSGAETAGILLAQGVKKGSKPEDVHTEYVLKALGTAWMTLGIGYYFFFK